MNRSNKSNKPYPIAVPVIIPKHHEPVIGREKWCGIGYLGEEMVGSGSGNEEGSELGDEVELGIVHGELGVGEVAGPDPRHLARIGRTVSY